MADRADLGPAVLGEARRWEDLLDTVGERAVAAAGRVADRFCALAARIAADVGRAVLAAAAPDGTVTGARAAIGDAAVSLALGLPRLDDPAWDRFEIEDRLREAVEASAAERAEVGG